MVSFDWISTWTDSINDEYLALRGTRILKGRWTLFRCYVIKGAQTAQYAPTRRTGSHTVISYPISLFVGFTDVKYLVPCGSGISKGRRISFKRYVIKGAQYALRRRACLHAVSFYTISLFIGSNYDECLVLYGSGISKGQRISFQHDAIKCA